MRYAAIIGLVVALILFFVAITIVSDVVPPPPAPIVVQPDSLLTTVVKPRFYGFVPGGVQAVGQFKRALSADAALAAQFPGFDWSRAHFEVLSKSECVYIAFRKGDQFAWTNRCKMLYRGELILTDGRYRIRAACANKISFGPQVPTIPPDDPGNSVEIPPIDATTPPIDATIPPTQLPSAPIGVLPPVPSTPITVLPPPPSPPIFCCAVPVPPVTKVPAGDDQRFMLGLVILVVAFAMYRRVRCHASHERR
jgi:hypothetical protein